MGKTLNFNIGVLGHVDSGKTSLVKAISTQASTACFDKNPESRERGITLDLGFSSLKVDTPPPRLAAAGYTGLHLTLVDCPGHASLIRTIIGGAQIIDLMLLVIDLTKGVQTQTAECLVIGEIICTNLLVVINKTDLVEESKREAVVEKMKKRLRATLQKTKFGTVDMLAVAARPGGPDSTSDPVGLAGLVERLVTAAAVPIRPAENASRPAVLSVDHCFAVRGSGTVVTGTLLQGRLAVGDTLELPIAKIQRKVKSIQQFRVGVDAIEAGDRAGVCLTQLDPASLERGVVCSPGAVPLVPALTASLALIPFYKGEVASGARFHLSLGHETVMARLTLFSGPEEPRPGTEQEFSYQERLERDSLLPAGHRQWVLLELERPVPLLPGCVTIGSRLDTDVNSTSCRLAFHGRPVWWAADREGWGRTELPRLKVFKLKSKEGVVERAVNEQEVIVRDLFKRETNMELFSGLSVRLTTGEEGILTGGFGQSGKVKVRLMTGLAADTLTRIGTGGKKGRETVVEKPVSAMLTFKRYIFDPDKKIVKL